jgi:polysaccharide deacetylase family protein (PEP-CTERM system associated)
MSLFLTFDIEDWYHANYREVVAPAAGEGGRSNFERNVHRLIELCHRLKIRSTCFVLGEMGEKFPAVIRALHEAGHEIASHGQAHRLVHTMTPAEFREDLTRSCQVLEQITREKILGFRAPSWSVRRENLGWYYETLQSQGLRYSSSIYPARTFLYGIEDFPAQPGYPVINGRRMEIFEIPVPVTRLLHRKVGYSGGFYLRFFPAWFIKNRLNRALAAGALPFVYLHPREIDPDQPRLRLSLLNRIIHYWGIRGCERKLAQVLADYADRILPIKEYLRRPWPADRGADNLANPPD